MFLKNNDIPNNDIFMYNAHNYFFLMPSLYSTVDAVQYSYLKQGDMFYYIMIALKKDIIVKRVQKLDHLNLDRSPWIERKTVLWAKTIQMFAPISPRLAY